MWFFSSERVLPLLSAAFLFAVLGSLSVPHPAHSQGFGVYEQGTCVMARAGATVAQGCGDGSSIYFNPANVAGTEGTTVSIGATLIDAYGGFTYDYISRAPYTGFEVDLDNDPIPVPHLYATYGVTDKLAVGLGTYVPYGLETVWPVKLDNGEFFDGAFEGYDNSVQAIYIQPTVAYQVSDRLTIGGGPVLVVSNVELNQALDLSTVEAGEQNGQTITLGNLGVPHHTAFGTSTLEGTGATGFGANFGVSFEATDRLRLGVRGTLPVTVTYDGEASFDLANEDGLKELVFVPPSPLSADTDGDGVPDQPVRAFDLVEGRFSGDGPLVTQDVETELTFPAQVVAGLSFDATEQLTLLADYQYTRWSSFDTIPLDFEKDALDQSREENYNDTHALRLGGSYDITETWTAQAGYLFNTPAAPDEVVTPLLPEARRNQATVGLGWRPTDLLEIHASYQLLLQNDRRGRVRGAPEGEDPTTALNSGLYEFGANLFGTTLTLHL